MPVRTFIVTGGAGFIGANVAAELGRREPGSKVVVVDSFRSGSFANIVEACARRGTGGFTGEVLPESSARVHWQFQVDRLKPAAVFHLGAITDTTVSDEALMLHENVAGFASMLSVCYEAKVPLVYASSAATYGTPPHAGRREAFPEAAAGQPSNVYGFSKWLMEQEHATFQGAFPKAHAVGLRYFNVFGPGEGRKAHMASMIFQLTRQLLGGKSPRLFRDGSQARDHVSVHDVVDCTIHASGLFGGCPKPGVYNLGSGVATSFNRVLEAVRGAIGVPESSVPTEYFEMPAQVRKFYQDFTLADMSRTAAGLGWKPSRAPAEAIGEYAGWLKDQG
ncbi:MAG: NAD-dependent epimerase/dehydratase family protein [Phycisphaerales bacterium]|nr:NAD-dependent epimerase/dehydratase family protein [Phycisphaerales bacterium]